MIGSNGLMDNYSHSLHSSPPSSDTITYPPLLHRPTRNLISRSSFYLFTVVLSQQNNFRILSYRQIHTTKWTINSLLLSLVRARQLFATTLRAAHKTVEVYVFSLVSISICLLLPVNIALYIAYTNKASPATRADTDPINAIELSSK